MLFYKFLGNTLNNGKFNFHKALQKEKRALKYDRITVINAVPTFNKAVVSNELYNQF